MKSLPKDIGFEFISASKPSKFSILQQKPYCTGLKESSWYFEIVGKSMDWGSYGTAAYNILAIIKVDYLYTLK